MKVIEKGSSLNLEFKDLNIGDCFHFLGASTLFLKTDEGSVSFDGITTFPPDDSRVIKKEAEVHVLD